MSSSGQVSSQFGHASVVPMHSHREALLVVSLRGTATIGTSGAEWALPSRSMLWLAGDTLHQVHSTPDHHWLVLAFPPETVARATGWIDASGFVHDLVERVGRAPDQSAAIGSPRSSSTNWSSRFRPTRACAA